MGDCWELCGEDCVWEHCRELWLVVGEGGCWGEELLRELLVGCMCGVLSRGLCVRGCV